MNSQRFGRSLATRLILAASVWGLIVLVLGGAGLAWHYRQTVLRQLDRELLVVLDTLTAQIELGPDGRPYLASSPSDPRFALAFSGRYWQISLEGACVSGRAGPALVASRSLWDTPILWPPEGCPAALAERPGTVQHANIPGPDDQALRVAGIMVRFEGLDPALFLYAAADRRPALAEAAQFSLVLGLSILALAAGLVVAVVLQVRVGLAPLDDLEADLAAIRRGKRTRLEGVYPREVAKLTDELNKLLDHNREVVDRARTHVGNLAHALKTPLSVLINEAAESPDALGALVRRQAEAMRANVEHYLARAHAAARAETIGARTPVAPVLEDLARMLERLYGRRQDLDLTLDLDAGPVFRGERQDLEEMAGNLMENACKYGGGTVEVRLKPDAGGQHLVLSIEDDGPGLDEAARARVVKRGERLDERAPGQGLGLSIVADLAQLYGGRLALEESPLGGLKAILTLPAAD
jgi:signal transduction histidine kinase